MVAKDKGFEELAEVSIETLRQVITDLDPTETRLFQARLASTSLASYTRYIQTQGAREAARFAMAAAVLPQEEVAEYIKLAMPDHKANIVMGTRKELEGAKS